MPDDVRRGIRGVLTDIDDTLTTDGVLPAPRARRSSAARAPACRSSRSPGARRDCATTSRVSGRSRRSSARTAASGCATTRRPAAVAAHYEHDEASGRASARRCATIAARRSPRCLAPRSPSTAIARDGPRDRLRGASRRSPRDEVDRIVAMMQHARPDDRRLVDPRPRLVRRRTTSWRRRSGSSRAAFGDRPRARSADATCSSATRRTTRRCSRSSRTRSASPTCALPRPHRHAACVRHARRGGRGIRRAGRPAAAAAARRGLLRRRRPSWRYFAATSFGGARGRPPAALRSAATRRRPGRARHGEALADQHVVSPSFDWRSYCSCTSWPLTGRVRS